LRKQEIGSYRKKEISDEGRYHSNETIKFMAIMLPLALLFLLIILSRSISDLVYYFVSGIYNLCVDFILGFIDIASSMINLSFIEYL
tara:strand:- start:42513 stop:42773 length:261 start_codon:yes stop_codon:yes gene_type:complete